MPLRVTSTCRAPLLTPARVLAVANPKSLWQWVDQTAFSEPGVRILSYQLRAKSRQEDELLVLRFVSEEFPDSEWAWLDLAEALERAGELEQALEHCRKTLELNPGNAEAAEMLARLEL